MKANNSWEERLHHFSHPFYAFIRSGMFRGYSGDTLYRIDYGYFSASSAGLSYYDRAFDFGNRALNVNSDHRQSFGTSVRAEH